MLTTSESHIKAIEHSNECTAHPDPFQAETEMAPGYIRISCVLSMDVLKKVHLEYQKMPQSIFEMPTFV